MALGANLRYVGGPGKRSLRAVRCYASLTPGTPTPTRREIDGRPPDRWDLVGGAIALVGVLVIFYAPRSAA